MDCMASRPAPAADGHHSWRFRPRKDIGHSAEYFDQVSFHLCCSFHVFLIILSDLFCNISVICLHVFEELSHSGLDFWNLDKTTWSSSCLCSSAGNQPVVEPQASLSLPRAWRTYMLWMCRACSQPALARTTQTSFQPRKDLSCIFHRLFLLLFSLDIS